MSDTIEFNYDLQPLYITSNQRYQLVVSAMKGSVRDISPDSSGTRGSIDEEVKQFETQLSRIDVKLDGAFELNVEPSQSQADGSRSFIPATVLRTDIAAQGFDSQGKIQKQDAALLVYDHSTGAVQWIPPEKDGPGIFTIPTIPEENFRSQPDTKDADDSSSRSPISEGVKRSVYVLKWLLGDTPQIMALSLASHWEINQGNGSYGFFHARLGLDGELIWDEFNEASAWEEISKGPALLLIHGTFSRSQSTWEGFLKQSTKELTAYYDNRIFAFNHPTLTQNPEENAQYFIHRIPDGIRLNLDIVMHSRGGLVGRELVDKLGKQSLGTVNKAIFVASPNAGTIIVNSDNWIQFGERFTNVLGFIPGNIPAVIEGVLLVLKIAQSGAFEGIPGLKAMDPMGDYIKELAAKSHYGATYYALAANYEPRNQNRFVNTFLDMGNKIVDKVFADTLNDLVVPTESCYNLGNTLNNFEANGFPIPPSKCRIFDDKVKPYQIYHTTFFNEGEISLPSNQQIIEWLTQAESNQ